MREHVIEYQLARSIHRARFIDLGVADDPAVLRPLWGGHDPETPTAYRTVEDAFDTCGRRLLLLGAPGAGKTTALLHLAKRIADTAERSSDAPVPLLLNLSAFRMSDPGRAAASSLETLRRPEASDGARDETRDTRVEDWVVEEITARTGLSRDLAREWLRDLRVAVFLDGLDEFDDERRHQLARLLNETFLRSHPFLPVLICSRVHEYMRLDAHEMTRLRLNGCIQLEPPTDEQVASYLTSARAEGLRDALREDPQLLELTRTPLTLSMLVLAYGGVAPANLRSAGSLAARRHQLFESYVAGMLQRVARRAAGVPNDDVRENDLPVSRYRYDPRSVERWLGWLAVTLSVRMRTGFSSSGFHSILRSRSDAQRQALNRLASQLAIGGFLAIALLAVAAAMVVRSADSWIGGALVIAIAACVHPAASALAGRGQGSASRIAAGVIGLAGFGALCHALSNAFPTQVQPMPLSVILAGTVVAAAGILEFILDRSSRTSLRGFAIVAAVTLALGYSIPWAPEAWPLPWRADGWLEAGVIAVGIAGANAARAGRRRSEPPGLAFVSTVVAAGLCIAGAAVVGRVDGPIALALLAASCVGCLVAAGVETGVVLVAVLCVSALAGTCAAGPDGLLIATALAGALLSAGALLRSLARKDGRHGESLVAEHLDRICRAVHRRIEGVSLSPCLWGLVAMAGRFPWRRHRFIAHCQEAFLLKRSHLEFEFMQRLLRDHFALRELLPRLASPDLRQQIQTIRALGYQGESALEPLVALLDHADPNVRAAAISGLAHISLPAVMFHLEQRVADPTPEVRRELIRALVVVGGPPAIELIERITPLGDGCEADPLLDGLERLPQFRGRLEEAVVRLGRPAVGTLISRLSDRSAETRLSVATVLGRLGDARAMDPLCALLHDKAAPVRLTAALALADLGDARALGPLQSSLRDANPFVRTEVIRALARLRERRPRPLDGAAGDADR